MPVLFLKGESKGDVALSGEGKGERPLFRVLARGFVVGTAAKYACALAMIGVLLVSYLF